MLAITKPIRYVFYRILTWKLRDSREALPVATAAGILLVLLDANLLAPYLLVSHLTGRSTRWLSEWPGIGRGGAYVLAGVMTFGFARLLAYLWVDAGRFDQLVKEFQSSSAARLRVRTILFWSYIVLSVAFPIAVAIFLRAR
jgi:hypothetical protein